MTPATIHLFLKKLNTYEPQIVTNVAILCHNHELSTLFDEPRKINGNTANFSAATHTVAFIQTYSFSDHAVHQQFTLKREPNPTVTIFQTVYNKPYRKTLRIEITQHKPAPASKTISPQSPRQQLPHHIRNAVPLSCNTLRDVAKSIVNTMDRRLAIEKFTAPKKHHSSQNSFNSITLHGILLHSHPCFQGLNPFEYWPSDDDMDTDDET